MSANTVLERRPSRALQLAQRESAELGVRPEPCALVIFGATGDLARRKLLPALYAVAVRGLLPARFALIGASRSKLTTDEWLAFARASVLEYARDPFREDVWESLTRDAAYIPGEADKEPAHRALADTLATVDERSALEGNRLYYLAVPPDTVPAIARQVARHRRGEGWRRAVIEKPFGHDRASARELNELLHGCFSESEIFRIDHYLGKEAVQNLLVFRFANGVFEPLWTRQFVDHIEITVAESIGIEGRSEYYEQTGAVRDMLQNHVLQLLALTAMEPPLDFSPEHVRNEKVKVLRALRTPGPDNVVRGQYGRGIVDGLEVPGYREEPGVARDSTTETYVAASLVVDNWRWADRPFYVRTGKRLARRETTIVIHFTGAPHPPFHDVPAEDLRPNALVVRIQPDAGISLEMVVKAPGHPLSVRPVQMDFPYERAFGNDVPTAYERLLVDAMLGDATLFTRADEIEEQWALVDAIVASWRRDEAHFPNYPAGTWGPDAARELLRRGGHSWRDE